MKSVNEILHKDITKLDYTLIPPNFQGDVQSMRLVQGTLSRLINQLGELSATAQGLNKVITNAEKLQNSQNHFLYLLKDANANGGQGEVIGLLKVGQKHLFLFDHKDQVREVEPICVLDFFVLQDRQRHGYGKALFDHMLKDLETSPSQLAIDGPSPKMEQFLTRNYGIHLVKQNNNFAIAPQFFEQSYISKSSASTPALSPAVGRYTAAKPHSVIGSVIHGGYNNENYMGQGHDLDWMTLSSGSPSPPSKHKSPSRPSSLPVAPAVASAEVDSGSGVAPLPEQSPAGYSGARHDSQLTERGYVDMKFYHNKLWC
ncbi:hypothetical protein K1T71_005656 [Dendrolimus kikuchii]|uniref:Uncharacterized protein n=1 Tax=Dendrolimus kikuchii TaxID=765133 RepID=A0ACC1D4Z5_9NEOP|nr:hypothetical protein K1T71_005656 [Dendrolimus kikuchii]